MIPADAWAEEDPTLCPVCGRDACEDHLPLELAERQAPSNGRPVADRDDLLAETEYRREKARRQARRRLEAEERPLVVVPPFDTLRERLARPVVQTPWRIQRWQPTNGRVMLAAQFKAGKTTLRDNYIRSKVDGDLFLGRDAVTPLTGRLVVIDTEMSDYQLDAWLRAQRIRDDDRVIPITLRGRAATFNLLDETCRHAWADRLKAHHAEDFVLDCVRPVLDALGLDEQREAGRFLVALDALLLEAGIPEALVIHHMGHGNERARGDSRLRDWPDVEWRLVRRDENPASARFITAYGRDVDIPESQLIYDSLTRHLTIEDGSRRDVAGRDAIADVCGILRIDGPLSGRAVKKALADADHARGAIETALRIGVETGVIVKGKGPKGANLYSALARVSQCPEVSQNTLGHSGADLCPSVPTPL